MSEEKNMEVTPEVQAEAQEPAQTMEDFAEELEASLAAMDQDRIEAQEDDSKEGAQWAQFAQMMEDKTVVKVKISEAVKGGVVAYVDGVRAFIPASQLSTSYVEKLEDWQGKYVETVIITVDRAKKRLVLSGRQVEMEKKEAERKERLAQFKAGDVVEGTVDSLKPYGAFVRLADGVDGLGSCVSDQHPAHQAPQRCTQRGTDRKGEDSFRGQWKDQPEHEGSGRAAGGQGRARDLQLQGDSFRDDGPWRTAEGIEAVT